MRRFQRQWGARDFDKYAFNLLIPRFDENDELRRPSPRRRRKSRSAPQASRGSSGRAAACAPRSRITAELERLAEETFSAGRSLRAALSGKRPAGPRAIPAGC